MRECIAPRARAVGGRARDWLQPGAGYAGGRNPGSLEVQIEPTHGKRRALHTEYGVAESEGLPVARGGGTLRASPLRSGILKGAKREVPCAAGF